MSALKTSLYNDQVASGASVPKDTRIAKQQIERLNHTFKESYRITTGYGTLKRAIASFEL
ncbi:hypothetical protein RN96_01090 [Fusobacterium polymorphum]|uniref:Transposase n=1 Tax=Fusobacterium nucleatum subsp. polymorphum TaxID=76857 RepID=A0A2B7YKX3_FUSNP|nr:hypothetical protein [Fusobacterium polymorphum]PGH21850.1 hypothetical protein RN96_01090 [Fusobacterium polymorphum]